MNLIFEFDKYCDLGGMHIRFGRQLRIAIAKSIQARFAEMGGLDEVKCREHIEDVE